MAGKSRARIAHRKRTRLKWRGFPGSFSCVPAGRCKRRAALLQARRPVSPGSRGTGEDYVEAVYGLAFSVRESR